MNKAWLAIAVVALMLGACGPKQAPFINSLGMKFVPVPGTGVLFSLWDTRVQDFRAFATQPQLVGTRRGVVIGIPLPSGKKSDGQLESEIEEGDPVALGFLILLIVGVPLVALIHWLGNDFLRWRAAKAAEAKAIRESRARKLAAEIRHSPGALVAQPLLSPQEARADTEEKRALVAESISIVERIGSEEASPASYLKLEQHAAHFAEKGITADSFTDASDRALVQHYEQIVAAEQARQLDGMPRESFAAMSELKSWLRLGRVLAQHRPREIRAADDIERCKKQLSSIPVPESPKSFYEVALRTPRFVAPVATIVALWFVVLVLVILQRTGGENAHYGTGIVLGFLISGLTTFLLLSICSPFTTVKQAVAGMRSDFTVAQINTKKLLSQLDSLQRAKAATESELAKELGEIVGIDGDTLAYAAALEFPSNESKEFRKSAESYCEQLRESLGIHQSMIPVLESVAAIPG